MPTTLVDKLWDAHVIASSDEGLDLLHVDRSLLHDLSGTIGLEDLEADGRVVRNPALHLAVPDHAITTDPDNRPTTDDGRAERFVVGLRRRAAQCGIRHLGRGSGGQGITHVVGVEQAFTLPGVTLVCGDSHTTTHGALGALACGIGSSETKHVLATQTLWMRKPKQARIRLDGRPVDGVATKDVILHLIGALGADYGREHVIEFTGSYVDGLSIDSRSTLCNLAVELGARFAIVAPDDTAFDYLEGRTWAPRGDDWTAAVEYWRGLRTDEQARFDKEAAFDVGTVEPQVTWGISPEHVGAISGTVPADAGEAATAYMGLSPNQPLTGVAIDYAFIGSCANNRIEDLRSAAEIVRGRQVAAGVIAWVVPGSELVKCQAEEEGLDRVFTDAGFEWRQPGCSMCVAVNGDVVPPGKRCVSTGNRNFIGRQGPDARTHLASPTTVAASAIAGAIVDARSLVDGTAGRNEVGS
jgi:3-isopropylmalate/(R)-2-methylmalate dehydratase large subunit